MPKMYMNINLSNVNSYYPTRQINSVRPISKSSSLNSGMIHRIQSAKAGCGSCGR